MFYVKAICVIRYSLLRMSLMEDLLYFLYVIEKRLNKIQIDTLHLNAMNIYGEKK